MIPDNVLKFATEKNIGTYLMFKDYFNQYRSLHGAKNATFSTVDSNGNPISFAEKENAMNAALKKEIMRVAGIHNFEDFPLEQWVTNPTLIWSTFSTVNMLIDMIHPDVLIDSIGLYSEIKNIGWGDSALFDIEPNGLFTVSKAGRSQKTTNVHKQFKGTVSIVAEPRELTVAVSLYRVLSGAESLASFVQKAILSIESQITIDAYNAMNTLMTTGLPSTATVGTYVSGYSQANLLRICSQLESWLRVKPVVVGTPIALMNIFPDDPNYRYGPNDDAWKMGYVTNAFSYPVLALPNIADHSTPFGRIISDSYIWVLAPSAGKLIKVVMEGSTLAYTDSTFANANLMTRSVITKSWGVGVVTNSLAGCISL